MNISKIAPFDAILSIIVANWLRSVDITISINVVWLAMKKFLIVVMVSVNSLTEILGLCSDKITNKCLTLTRFRVPP